MLYFNYYNQGEIQLKWNKCEPEHFIFTTSSSVIVSKWFIISKLVLILVISINSLQIPQFSDLLSSKGVYKNAILIGKSSSFKLSNKWKYILNFTY